MAAPSVTAGEVIAPVAWAVRSSVPVAASPANSVALAAISTLVVLLTVISVFIGENRTLCLEQIAERMLSTVVVWISVAYAPLIGSEQVMVVAMLLVATDTMMLWPAVTAAMVGS